LELAASIFKRIRPMSNLIVFTFLSLTIYSCSTEKKKTADISKVVITADSCKKWGLPPINFEIEYPSDFKSE